MYEAIVQCGAEVSDRAAAVCWPLGVNSWDLSTLLLSVTHKLTTGPTRLWKLWVPCVYYIPFAHAELWAAVVFKVARIQPESAPGDHV